MKSIDIVAIGSCYLDINATDFPFTADGIPAQAELVGGGYELVPGGSAVNFCRLLQSLGQRTAFIGMAGDDQFAEILNNLLTEQKVQPFLVRKQGLLTNISFNLTGAGESHVMLVAGTASASLTPDVVLPKLHAVVADAELLYLGGCFKLKSFYPAFSEVAKLAKQQGTKLVVDHGRVPKDVANDMLEAVRNLVTQSDYYLPSREEFLGVWNFSDIEEGLRTLRQRAPQLTVVVKDGAKGAWFLDGDTTKQAKPDIIEKPVRLTGAGDSFNAGLIAALRTKRALPDAIAAAHKVAGTYISGRDVTAG
ncbi:MAG: carbohydrate kinase family protein [Candidatus Saccharimonadales bacterium]